MKPILAAVLVTLAVAVLSLVWSENATASPPSPELREVQARIEANVDRRLHDILDGFLADAG